MRTRERTRQFHSAMLRMHESAMQGTKVGGQWVCSFVMRSLIANTRLFLSIRVEYVKREHMEAIQLRVQA